MSSDKIPKKKSGVGEERKTNMSGRSHQSELDSPIKVVQKPSSDSKIPLTPEGCLIKIDSLEATISKLCNQHDALMPLISIANTFQNLPKVENTIKIMSKKLNTTENKLTTMEGNLGEYHSFIEASMKSFMNQSSSPSFNVAEVEKSIKGINSHMNSLQNNIKDVEQLVGNLQRKTDEKFRDELTNFSKSVDGKLERNRHDIQNMIAEFKNDIHLAVKMQEEFFKEFQSQAHLKDQQQTILQSSPIKSPNKVFFC